MTDAARLSRDALTVTCRPTLSSDDDFCRDLFIADRAPSFAALDLDERSLGALLDQQYRAWQMSLAASPNARDVIIFCGEAAVGRLVAVQRDDALHIVEIIMTDRARGQGLGSAVLDDLARVAGTMGAMRLSLSVLASNLRARRLYSRLGFRITGEDGVRIAMSKPLDSPTI